MLVAKCEHCGAAERVPDSYARQTLEYACGHDVVVPNLPESKGKIQPINMLDTKKPDKKKLLEKVLLAVGLKMARRKKHSETTSYPNGGGKTVVKTLMCIRIEDAADEEAMPVNFIDKDFGDMAFKFFDGESFFRDEDEIVDTLGRTREFMHWQVPDNFTKWQNPFFRCSSLEEMLIKIDILGLRKEQLACMSKGALSIA